MFKAISDGAVKWRAWLHDDERESEPWNAKTFATSDLTSIKCHLNSKRQSRNNFWKYMVKSTVCLRKLINDKYGI